MILKKPITLRPLMALGSLMALMFVAACGDDGDNIHYGNQTNDGSSTVSPTNEITARMETPQTLNDGSSLLLSHSTTESSGREVMAYCLEYVKNACHSRWVAFRFDGDTRGKNVSRSDEPFADDPTLPSELKIGSSGFGREYNRGHLCASADRLYSRSANEMTFYMTNMSPQLGSFNQAYWITLEGLVQKLGRDASFADTLYVVKGGTVKSGQTNGYITRDNGCKISIPKYYFMALLKIKNGSYSSIAFWMEHKEYGYTYENQAPLSVIREDAITVNQLEDLSGINFFPNLPDSQEEQIESQLLPANWKM